MFPSVAPQRRMTGSAKARHSAVNTMPQSTVKVMTREKVWPASFRLPSPTFLTMTALPPVPIMMPTAMKRLMMG